MNDVEFTYCLRESDIDVDVTADVDSGDVVLRTVLITSMKSDPTDIVKLLSARLRDELCDAALAADEHLWGMRRRA